MRNFTETIDRSINQKIFFWIRNDWESNSQPFLLLFFSPFSHLSILLHSSLDQLSISPSHSHQPCALPIHHHVVVPLGSGPREMSESPYEGANASFHSAVNFSPKPGPQTWVSSLNFLQNEGLRFELERFQWEKEKRSFMVHSPFFPSFFSLFYL